MWRIITLFLLSIIVDDDDDDDDDDRESSPRAIYKRMHLHKESFIFRLSRASFFFRVAGRYFSSLVERLSGAAVTMTSGFFFHATPRPGSLEKELDNTDNSSLARVVLAPSTTLRDLSFSPVRIRAIMFVN